MGLILLHPRYYQRDCQHCLKYEYNEETGEPARFHGRDLLRHHANPPLCRKPEGCPKGTPEKPNILSQKNMRAYIHYQECKAVGSFPDDPIVRRNARLIQKVVDQVEEDKRLEEISLMMGAKS